MKAAAPASKESVNIDLREVGVSVYGLTSCSTNYYFFFRLKIIKLLQL